MCRLVCIVEISGDLTISFEKQKHAVLSLQGNIRAVTPEKVHLRAAKVDSMFYNFKQQDSHELVVTWLDALAEDLNRNKKKTYSQVSKLSARCLQPCRLSHTATKVLLAP